MVKPAALIGLPIRNHLGYVKMVLSTRNEKSSDAFGQKIPGNHPTPLDLWYHGTNNLYRGAHHIMDLDSDFVSTNQNLPKGEDKAKIAIDLYEEAVSLFMNNLEKLELEDLENTLRSPISGSEITLASWIATNIMHTLHHVAQALRLQGIICKGESEFT